jgi:hypothetical protein
MMVIFGHLTKEQKLVHLGVMGEHNKRIRRQTPLRNSDKAREDSEISAHCHSEA